MDFLDVQGPKDIEPAFERARKRRADAGLVLTASHNPYEDNGIKFFRDDGYKLDDAVEAEDSGEADGLAGDVAVAGAGVAGMERVAGAVEGAEGEAMELMAEREVKP